MIHFISFHFTPLLLFWQCDTDNECRLIVGMGIGLSGRWGEGIVWGVGII